MKFTWIWQPAWHLSLSGMLHAASKQALITSWRTTETGHLILLTSPVTRSQAEQNCRDLPKTTKDLKCQSKTELCRLLLILQSSTSISHLGVMRLDSGMFIRRLTVVSFLEFHCLPIRSPYVRNKMLTGAQSQGCLLDSSVCTEHSLIIMSSLVSTVQWELPKAKSKQGHSYRNELNLM